MIIITGIYNGEPVAVFTTLETAQADKSFGVYEWNKTTKGWDLWLVGGRDQRFYNAWEIKVTA